MIIGSLFSGIGGLELGLEWAGLGPVIWQVEKDEKCRKVLEKHWPEAERFDDVQEVSCEQLKPVDLICGGFPCQDVSSAGNRKGLAGERSGLWFEFARIICELRPAWVVVENVTSGAKLWVDPVMDQLGELNYASIPIPISASDLGAPHIRKRIFILSWLPNLDHSKKYAFSEHGQMAIPSKSMGNAPCEQLRLAKGSQDRGGKKQKERTAGDRSHSRWPSKLEVVSPTHGISGWMVRALGNSVVPQCSQVVGEVIKQIMEAR